HRALARARGLAADAPDAELQAALEEDQRVRLIALEGLARADRNAAANLVPGVALGWALWKEGRGGRRGP
ncbi:MAG: hypothetical protein ACREM2_11240, partial [Vulcanimicrobiaceae bacterium]